jgi:putative transposase
VRDDFSQHVIPWKLCTTLAGSDVTETLGRVLEASGCGMVRVQDRPRPQSDNGPSYIAVELTDRLARKSMSHTRDPPCHLKTQGEIECWNQTLKNRVLLQNDSSLGEFEVQIAAFVEHNNHCRAPEGLQNFNPADADFGCGAGILYEYAHTKYWTIQCRRFLLQQQAK